jgi:hypothetical protein
MTWRTSWARLFERARRVRYAVATGGDASWGSKPVAAARPPARSDGAQPQCPKDGRNPTRRQNYSHRLSQNLKTET